MSWCWAARPRDLVTGEVGGLSVAVKEAGRIAAILTVGIPRPFPLFASVRLSCGRAASAVWGRSR